MVGGERGIRQPSNLGGGARPTLPHLAGGDEPSPVSSFCSPEIALSCGVCVSLLLPCSGATPVRGRGAGADATPQLANEPKIKQRPGGKKGWQFAEENMEDLSLADGMGQQQQKFSGGGGVAIGCVASGQIDLHVRFPVQVLQSQQYGTTNNDG